AAVGPLSPVELLDAAATACLLMAAADGEVSAPELRRIAEVLIAITGSLDERARVQRTLDRVGADMTPERQAFYIQDLAARITDADQRRKTLAYATAVAWAEECLDFEEEARLFRLADAFSVPKREVQSLIRLFDPGS